ncbi:MAG TPA: hypothetical protein VEW48_07605 [Thermoanaerobaculia bacterium]|nr:hypothetical protein [Thermoanaerobaculia bacterium]
MSREESRLAKVIDIRRWREEKVRQARPSPEPAAPSEPRPRALALTLGFACCAFGLGLAYLPFWALVHAVVSRFSLGLLFGLVLPAGLGIAFLGADLIFRACLGRAGEGWYLRRIGRRRRTLPASGEDPSRFGSRPHEL